MHRSEIGLFSVFCTLGKAMYMTNPNYNDIPEIKEGTGHGRYWSPASFDLLLLHNSCRGSALFYSGFVTWIKVCHIWVNLLSLVLGFVKYGWALIWVLSSYLWGHANFDLLLLPNRCRSLCPLLFGVCHLDWDLSYISWFLGFVKYWRVLSQVCHHIN